jgi:PAS domain S-box-containing protein
VCYLKIQYAEVEALFDAITENAKQHVDAGIAHKALIMSCVARHELGGAISLAERYLERLHVTLDSERESNLPVAELYKLPQMEDEEKLAAMEVLTAILTPVLFSAPERFKSVVYTMLNLISRHGNNSKSGFAYASYAYTLCLMQRYEEGNRFGQLAVDLLEKYPDPGRAPGIMNIQYTNVRHWRQPVHDQITPLKACHRMAMQAGDFEYGLYSLLNYTLLLWGSGKPLDYYIAEVEPSIALCQSKNQQFSLLVALMFAEYALNLTGMSPSTTQLEGKWFSEEAMMSRLEGNQMLLAVYGLLKMKLCYLFGDPGAAYRQTQDVLKYRGSLNPHYLYTKISFYGALSCIAGLPDGESDADWQERLGNLRLFEEELKLWAEVAPMNYQHQYHLLQAEKSRIAEDHWKAAQLYEEAIKEARENRFVHDEALANELCARFWQESGNDKIAETYMREARALYYRWGASAKVSHLENSYPQWFRTGAIPEGRPDASSTDGTTPAHRVTPIELDSHELAEASRSLSSETEPERLLAKLMELVMSYSGAKRAVLLWEEGVDWFVQALSDIASGEQEILPNRPFDPADRELDLVPEPVFHYCRRTKESMVVGDARSEPMFAEDRVVQAHGARSMACIPALSGGELRGMLYLENSEMAGVFSRERVEILNYLVSQFAVSLENALLYESLNRKVRELQASDERYELAVAGSAAGLWDWDIASNELYTSDRLNELLGFAPDEISITLDWFWEQLHPDDYPAARLALEKHLEGRVPYDIEYRFPTKSGEYRWFHARGQALWDEAGKAIRMSGSLTDITDTKQVEEGLRQSKEFNQSVLMSLPDHIAVLDREGNILAVNHAWMEFARGNDASFPNGVGAGVNYLSICQKASDDGDETATDAFDGIRSVLDGSSGYFDMEYPCHSPSVKRWFLMTVSPFKGLKGGVIVAHIDITPRKLAEEALRDSRRRLLEAEGLAGTGFLDWDLKTNEMVWSKGTYELYGIDPETPASLEMTVGMIHPDDREFVNENLDLAVQGIRDYDIDHRMFRPDGEVIWVHARADLEWDSEGMPSRLLGTVVDITERKLAEEKLTNSEERFRNLMEQSPLGIVVLTPDGQITQVNSAWMRAWGIDELETARVMAEYNFLTDPQMEELGVMPLVEKAFAGERVVLPPIEYSGKRAMADMRLEDIEPRTLWIQIHLYSVKDEQGAVAYVVGINFDITDLKKAEREAREQREVLARLDRATSMGKLTGSIAHELNQPLTGILSTAQAGEIMLKSPDVSYEPDELVEILTAIVADAKRAGAVIRNLRELYGKHKGEFEPVDVNAIVDETAQLLYSELVVQAVALATEYAPTSPTVLGNRIQIQQVLVNLITNGIQAMSGAERVDRRIRIATAYGANEARVWVEDCGPGIDPDKLDRVFEPLSTWKPGGTGMGLAISNSIIEGHGGRMWAENRPEGGARVGFVLPVLKEDHRT